MTHYNIYNSLNIIDEIYFYIPNDIKTLICDYIPLNIHQIQCDNCHVFDFHNKYNFYECQICEWDIRKRYCFDCSIICSNCDSLYCEFHKFDYYHICLFCNKYNLLRQLKDEHVRYY